MICSKCNKEVSNENKFCPYCGEPLVTEIPVVPATIENQFVYEVPVAPQTEVTVNNNEVNNKQPNNKKKIIIIILLIVLLVGVGGGLLAINLLKDNDEAKETTNDVENLIADYTTDYEFLTIDSNNEYLIKDADKFISFEVSEGTTFEVLDENNKIINAVLKDSSIVYDKGYEEGKLYTIKIDNGSFISEKIKDVKIVKFKIAREEVKHHKFNEGLKKAKEKDISISEDKLTSSKKYKVGDVVTVYDGKDLVDAYEVKFVNDDGSYSIEDATPDKVYKELDYYYTEYADLTDYKTIEAIEEYLIADAKSSSWYSYLVDEVKAAPKFSIHFEKADDGLKAEVKVEVAAGEKTLFLNSKNHNFSFTYTNVIKVEKQVDVTLTNWDVTLRFIIQQNFDFSIDNKKLDYEMEKDKTVLQGLQKAIKEDKHRDKSTKKQDILTIPIPVFLGFAIELEVDLVSKLDMSIDLDVGVGVLTDIVVGFDYGKNETFKPLSSVNFKMNGLNVDFKGNIEERLGISIGAQISFLSIIDGGISCAGGLYGSASLGISEDVNASEFKANATIELGTFVELSLDLEVLAWDFSYVFFDKTFPFYENGWEFVYNYEKGDSQTTFNGGEITTEGEASSNGTNTSTPPKDKIEVKFDTQGGNNISSQFVEKNGKVIKPSTPIRDGFTFIEWTLDGKVFNFDTKITKSITLVASWKKMEDKYACTYDGELTAGAKFVKGEFTYTYKKEYVDSSWKNMTNDGWHVKVTDKYTRRDFKTDFCRTINGKPITSMSDLFSYSGAKSIDMSEIDTTYVTNMAGMFSGVNVNVDLCKMNTSNVRDMHDMFNWADMPSIDISCLDTSNVTNMSGMFELTAATNINLNKVNTSSVVNFHNMFTNSKVPVIDVSSFNTSNATDMGFMFSRTAATTIKGLENFNTSNVTDMSYMFHISKATSLNLTSFDTKKVQSMSEMFSQSSVTELDLSSFSGASIQLLGTMRIFSNSSIQKVYVSDASFSQLVREEILTNSDTSDDAIQIISK